MRILLAILLFAFSVSAQGIGGKAGFGGKAGIGGGAVVSVTPVAFDSKCATVAHGGTTTTTLSCTLTIGSITNGAVFVGISFYIGAGNPSAITCTVGGTSAALVTGSDSGTTSSTARSLIYTLATGSTTGAQTVTCSWTTATSAVISALSFANVNQSTPSAHGSEAGIASAGAIATTITSATNDYTLSVGCGLNNNSLTAATQTQEYIQNDTASFEIQGAGQIAAGAATVAHQWTASGSASISGVDIPHL